jgi:hypothetical protein
MNPAFHIRQALFPIDKLQKLEKCSLTKGFSGAMIQKIPKRKE